MSDAGWVVGIVGAAGLVGSELMNVLKLRQFPVREWRLFESAERLAEIETEGLEGRVDVLESADL